MMMMMMMMMMMCDFVCEQEGLLSCLANLRNITLSRNAFVSYPLGGPAQFCSVIVSDCFR